MGCDSSKAVMTKIEDQEKKIDNLIQINKELEQKLNEMQMNNGNEVRHSNDKNDLTHLRTTIDSRFSKLEKNVEKIHNEFKLKLFEGISDQTNGDNGNPNESLDLNFGKEKDQQAKRSSNERGGTHIASHNQIKLDVHKEGKNFGI